MVRDGGLAEVKLALDVADADLAFEAAEEVDDLQPHGMAERLEHAGQLVRFGGREAQAGRQATAGFGFYGDCGW